MPNMIVKKMSTKTVFGSKTDIQELVLADKTKPVNLFDVIGIARTVAKGETAMGPWVAFIGDFRAKSYNPKYADRVFVSGRLFLGGPAEDLLLGQMLPQSDNYVEFAFTIQAQFDETSATSYTYQAVPLVEPSADDPIERLRRKLTGGQLRLAATGTSPGVAPSGPRPVQGGKP